MKFLGTGAGEGIPNPFCNCKICENARKVKGREIRTRSSFMLSRDIIIDIGADFFTQSFLHDVSFVELKHVLFTHMHDDHINYTAIWERFASRSGNDKPINIYFVGEAYKFMTDFYLISPVTEGRELYFSSGNIKMIRLEFDEEYEIGKFKITPVRASHSTVFEKNGSNFLIKENGRKLYYALDSGYFIKSAFDMLKGIQLDILICECTFPTTEETVDVSSGHMDIKMCLKNLDKLYRINAITEKTQIYLSHISPMGMTHKELSEYVAGIDRKYKIQVAFDGLEIGYEN